MGKERLDAFLGSRCAHQLIVFPQRGSCYPQSGDFAWKKMTFGLKTESEGSQKCVNSPSPQHTHWHMKTQTNPSITCWITAQFFFHSFSLPRGCISVSLASFINDKQPKWNCFHTHQTAGSIREPMEKCFKEENPLMTADSRKTQINIKSTSFSAEILSSLRLFLSGSNNQHMAASKKHWQKHYTVILHVNKESLSRELMQNRLIHIHAPLYPSHHTFCALLQYCRTWLASRCIIRSIAKK